MTTSLQVLFGLLLSLGPSTSYSIHFFTQSLSFNNCSKCGIISQHTITKLRLFLVFAQLTFLSTVKPRLTSYLCIFILHPRSFWQKPLGTSGVCLISGMCLKSPTPLVSADSIKARLIRTTGFISSFLSTPQVLMETMTLFPATSQTANSAYRKH